MAVWISTLLGIRDATQLAISYEEMQHQQSRMQMCQGELPTCWCSHDSALGVHETTRQQN